MAPWPKKVRWRSHKKLGQYMIARVRNRIQQSSSSATMNANGERSCTARMNNVVTVHGNVSEMVEAGIGVSSSSGNALDTAMNLSPEFTGEMILSAGGKYWRWGDSYQKPWTMSIGEDPQQELQSPEQPCTLNACVQVAYAVDRKPYSRDGFQNWYGPNCQKAWDMAVQVTRQVTHTLQILNVSGCNVDDVIFLEHDKDKNMMASSEKYQKFAQSLVDPLYWRLLGLQRWKLNMLDSLNKAQGKWLWQQWLAYFSKNELTAEQRKKGRSFKRRAHLAHVRRLCGSANIARQVMTHGVQTQECLLDIIQSERARRSRQQYEEIPDVWSICPVSD